MGADYYERVPIPNFPSRAKFLAIQVIASSFQDMSTGIPATGFFGLIVLSALLRIFFLEVDNAVPRKL